MLLWDRLEFNLFRDLMFAIPPAFNHAKDLNIYEWNRTPEDGSIEFFGGFLTQWDFMDCCETDAEEK